MQQIYSSEDTCACPTERITSQSLFINAPLEARGTSMLRVDFPRMVTNSNSLCNVVILTRKLIPCNVKQFNAFKLNEVPRAHRLDTRMELSSNYET